MKVLMLTNMRDLQTGPYVYDSFKKLGHEVNFIDVRVIISAKGYSAGQQTIIDTVAAIPEDPDVILVFKGLEMTYNTLNKIKTAFPNTKLINWFFDAYFSEKPIWEEEKSFSTIRLYNHFMCSLKGVADKLQEKGFSTAIHLPEGCHPENHGELPINSIQKKKYATDVTFIGSLGLNTIHKNRIEYLTAIINADIPLKIWGGIIGDVNSIPEPIKQCMTNQLVINKSHSIICQSSKINLGLDQDISLDESWSARLYRIMCSGSLYLSVATKGLENHFVINKEGEQITSEQDLIVFYNEADLIEKIKFIKENPDISEAIGINGQRKVLENHTFEDRVKQMIKILGEK